MPIKLTFNLITSIFSCRFVIKHRKLYAGHFDFKCYSLSSNAFFSLLELWLNSIFSLPNPFFHYLLIAGSDPYGFCFVFFHFWFSHSSPFTHRPCSNDIVQCCRWWYIVQSVNTLISNVGLIHELGTIWCCVRCYHLYCHTTLSL